MSLAWDPEFESELRKHVKLLLGDSPLEADASLVDLGLDSLGMVGLLVDLETLYEIEFPDSSMNLETFATAGNLWGVVSRLRGIDG
ncbi:phosphopantetheine-binding protein [Plantactinospora soyae]|uniref:Acyl carrier protein n=1 Tax=Plantactinospora soyae TaxID=1544732 RepID=A0A927M4Y0_9ACTN|nr:phosphopantetheine-binding protein [Plantactinospora soyae]MBE1485543.1 acyl carrier protein [Plantactinospora soyae]